MKSSNMLEHAAHQAIAGRNVFYVSDCEATRSRHVEQAKAHAINFGGRLIPSERSPYFLRAGTGSLQFYTLRTRGGFYVRPSLDPNKNADAPFRAITLGIHKPLLLIDHYAEYLIDRDRRRQAKGV